MLDERYLALDNEIELGGYQPGHSDYNALVRKHMDAATKAVDAAFGRYFRWPKPGVPGLPAMVVTDLAAATGKNESQ
jgi:hypothetical protein